MAQEIGQRVRYSTGEEANSVLHQDLSGMDHTQPGKGREVGVMLPFLVLIFLHRLYCLWQQLSPLLRLTTGKNEKQNWDKCPA